jgi:hypothetical protein
MIGITTNVCAASQHSIHQKPSLTQVPRSNQLASLIGMYNYSIEIINREHGTEHAWAILVYKRTAMSI